MVVLLLALMDWPKYEEALAKADKSNKPLIVVVSASWCGPCKVQKATITGMEKSELKDTVITVVDVDERPDLAKSLMDGSTVPQVVMFDRSGQGWKRVRAVGVQAKDRILEMLRRVRGR